MKAHFLCFFALTLLFLGSLAAISYAPLLTEKEEIMAYEESEAEMAPDSAVAWDNFMIQDPATQNVPIQRLWQVIDQIDAYSDAIQAGQAPPFGTPNYQSIPGIKWIEMGPRNVSGRTRSILIDKSDASGNTVWAGGASGGLWKTNNGGVNWLKVDDFFDNLAINAIAQHPTNPLIMYFGIGEAQFAQYSPISPTTNNDGVQGAGEIWWTNNGGQTWSKLLNNIDPTFAQGNQSKFICFQYVQKIVVATNGDTYVGTRSNGVMRLQNGGNNTTGYWYRVTGQTGALYPYTFVTDLEQAADGTFYAGIMIISTGNVSQAALFKSTTGAQGTWNMVTGYPLNNATKWMNIACGSGNPSALYVLTASDLGGPINSPCGFLSGNGIEGFHKSLNGGSTWTSISLPVDVNTCVSYVGFPDQMTRLQAWYNLALAIHPTDNNKMYIGGINPFRTINGGISWQQVSEENGQGGLPIIHPDQHTFVFKPSNPNIMYLGNDGGIYRSANAWVSPPTVPTIPSRRIDYNVTQLYSVAVHPTNWQLLTGSQDNGTLRFNGSGYQSTNIVLGGDGGYCFIDQNNPTFQIASYVSNYWYRSTNSGATFSAIPNSTGDGLFTNPADFDDINNILYSSSTQGYVARRTNITATPIVSYLALPDNYIASHVKVSPNTATNLYVM